MVSVKRAVRSWPGLFDTFTAAAAYPKVPILTLTLTLT